uniref:BTB domain-containing protein n=1 Tax=Strongyloides papillosus TaxID=174720 RepID=A0A0N5C048_STREA
MIYIISDDSFNIQTKVNKFNYVCSIRNFSLRPEKTGEKIMSQTCVIGDKDKSEWCLWIYPNGDDEESKEYVSVYLTLLNPDKAKVKVRFSILNDKEEEINVDNIDEVIDLTKNLGLGIPKFIKKDFLLDKSNGLLNDDKLTILCEGEIINFKSDDQDSTETLRKVTIPQSKLLSNYGNMFDSSLFTDCIIKVEDTEIKAHKAVLAARSPVFCEIFNGSSEESQTNVIEIKDFQVEVVREMLRYIYTDEVSDIQNMANDVLAIADIYKLERLKAISAQYLCDDLTVFNVCERFVLSEKYSTEILKECCIELIIENAAWLSKTKEWKEFILVHPLLLESLFLKSSSASSTESIPEKGKKEYSDT